MVAQANALGCSQWTFSAQFSEFQSAHAVGKVHAKRFILRSLPGRAMFRICFTGDAIKERRKRIPEKALIRLPQFQENPRSLLATKARIASTIGPSPQAPSRS